MALPVRSAAMRVAQQEPLWPCLLAADAVVGMSSMALLEAALAGRPALSFRPGATAAARALHVAPGLIPTATTVEELTRWVRRQLSGRSGASADRARRARRQLIKSLARGKAAARIAELILRVAEPARRAA